MPVSGYTLSSYKKIYKLFQNYAAVGILRRLELVLRRLPDTRGAAFDSVRGDPDFIAECKRQEGIIKRAADAIQGSAPDASKTFPAWILAALAALAAAGGI